MARNESARLFLTEMRLNVPLRQVWETVQRPFWQKLFIIGLVRIFICKNHASDHSSYSKIQNEQALESRKSSRYAKTDKFQFDGHVRRGYKTCLPVLLLFHVGFKKLRQPGFSTKYKVQALASIMRMQIFGLYHLKSKIMEYESYSMYF